MRKYFNNNDVQAFVQTDMYRTIRTLLAGNPESMRRTKKAQMLLQIETIEETIMVIFDVGLKQYQEKSGTKWTH